MKQAAIGFAAGVLAAAAAIAAVAPRAMLSEIASPLDLASAVVAITNRAVGSGWAVSSVIALDERVQRHGGDPGQPARVIKLCHASHAGAILRDRARIAATLMPCSIAVYETPDGVRIGAMNAGLLGRLFGGVIGRVMAGPVGGRPGPFRRSGVAAGCGARVAVTRWLANRGLRSRTGDGTVRGHCPHTRGHRTQESQHERRTGAIDGG